MTVCRYCGQRIVNGLPRVGQRTSQTWVTAERLSMGCSDYDNAGWRPHEPLTREEVIATLVRVVQS